MTWKANCDLQLLVDKYKAIEYASKYASKVEPASNYLQSLMKDAVDNMK